MLHKPPGTLSAAINKKWIALILLQALILLSFAGHWSWRKSSATCIHCHADAEEMERLGHPELLINQEMVADQSGHFLAECRDCHLGDGRSMDKDKSHRGMLKMIIVGDDLRAKDRRTHYPGALSPTGENRIFELLPKVMRDGRLASLPVRNLLWHDRDPDTFNFDPDIARLTCGKSGCHPDQVNQFTTTVMAANRRQRTMRTWNDPYGPHNCGPSFADLPPAEVLTATEFDSTNTKRIAADLNMPFSREQAEDRQRTCNTCHTGCLDCHFSPRAGEPHRFERTPSPETCGGGGRSTSMCHSGASHSRRGETYVGGDYSIPFGMTPDVHYELGIGCTDCHLMGEKGMGDMERRATCGGCHVAVEEALAKSIHKNMDCAACHINELGGYQLTVWGPGYVGYEWNPFYKYGLYYGIQSPPILMRDQKDVWMPVKVMPHSVGNIKTDVAASEGIRFRWPDGETRDPYFVIGTVDGLPANNKHLLWLEFQQAAHPFGPSRSCENCHQETQRCRSRWEFIEDQGALESFTGGYEVVADGMGLAVTDLRADGPVTPFEQYTLSDFAAWIYVRDHWRMPGDFKIPGPPHKVAESRVLYNERFKQIEIVDDNARRRDLNDHRRYRELRAAALHGYEQPETLAALNQWIDNAP
jgi:hypothetical protein